MKRLILLALLLVPCLSSSEIWAETVRVTPRNLSSLIYLGGKGRLICNSGTGQIGRLLTRRLVKGAKIKVIKARKEAARLSRILQNVAARLKQSELGIAQRKRLENKKAHLEENIAALNTASATCSQLKQCKRGKCPSSSSSSTSSSSTSSSNDSSPSPGALTPIARWDVVPYQRIGVGDTLNLGVVAFSKAGIDRVEFSISGQGYSGGVKTSKVMRLNPQTNVNEYWAALEASEFLSDGSISIAAKVFGKDGGLRDSSTNGGNQGLDALTLSVNPKGTLPQPQAWVDAQLGNDLTGQVNNRAQPYRTILFAMLGLAAANNGTADGSIIRLMPGTHTTDWENGWRVVPTHNEWVTITRDSSGTLENTTLIRGPENYAPTTTLMKVKGITLGAPPAGASELFRGGVQEYLWVDESKIIGRDRWEFGPDGCMGAETNPVDRSHEKKFLTNSYMANVPYGVGLGLLARNLTIEHIGDDIFESHPLVVNVRVDDDASPWRDPAKCGDDHWHSDAWQWFHGPGAQNAIMYNYRATNMHVEAIFANPAEPSHDVAFVNNYLELTQESRWDSNFYNAWDHVLFWHNTFRQLNSTHSVFFFTGEITNASFIGNVFDDFFTDHPDWLNRADIGFEHNHYRSGEKPDYWLFSPGSDVTSGDPGLDAYGKPLAASPLRSRASPLVVPADADNYSREPAPGDIGAYEY